MPGYITYINEKNKWGYIKGYDEELYYFEFTSLMFPQEKLANNLEVNFEVNLNGIILYALDIKLA